MSQSCSCSPVLVWLQSVDAHEAGSLPPALTHVHTQCLPSPNKYKLELLIEHKHNEDVEWRRQVPAEGEADLRHAPPEDAEALLSLLSPALKGSMGQPQPQGAEGRARGQRHRDLLSFCLLPTALAGQAPGQCSHDMTHLHTFRQLCPQAKNFYKILTRTISDNIHGPGQAHIIASMCQVTLP